MSISMLITQTLSFFSIYFERKQFNTNNHKNKPLLILSPTKTSVMSKERHTCGRSGDNIIWGQKQICSKSYCNRMNRNKII